MLTFISCYNTSHSLIIASSKRLHHLYNTCLHIYHFSEWGSTRDFLSELDKRLLLGKKLHKHKGHIQNADRPPFTSSSNTQTHIRMTTAGLSPAWFLITATNKCGFQWGFSFVCLRGCCSKKKKKTPSGLNLNILVTACWQNSTFTSEVHCCWVNRRGEPVTTCSTARLESSSASNRSSGYSLARVECFICLICMFLFFVIIKVWSQDIFKMKNRTKKYLINA